MFNTNGLSLKATSGYIVNLDVATDVINHPQRSQLMEGYTTCGMSAPSRLSKTRCTTCAADLSPAALSQSSCASHRWWWSSPKSKQVTGATPREVSYRRYMACRYPWYPGCSHLLVYIDRLICIHQEAGSNGADFFPNHIFVAHLQPQMRFTKLFSTQIEQNLFSNFSRFVVDHGYFPMDDCAQMFAKMIGSWFMGCLAHQIPQG